MTSAVFPAGLKHVATLPTRLHLDVLIHPFTITVFLDKVAQAFARLSQPHDMPEAMQQHA
jgi:hypothetical protein